MRLPRRPRGLTGEEARLWSEIAKLITPLRGRARPMSKPDPAEHPSAPAKGAAKSGAKGVAKGVAKGLAKSPPTVAAPPATAGKAPATAAKFPKRPGASNKPAAALVKPAAAAVKPAAAKPPPLPTAAPYQAPLPVPRQPSGLERQARLGLRRGTLAVEARIDLHGMFQGEAHAALTGFLLRARAAGHAHVLVVTGKGGPEFGSAFAERGVLRRSVPHWLRGPELSGIVLGFEEAARHHGGAGALYVRLRRR